MTKATRECLLKIRDLLADAGWARPHEMPTSSEAMQADWDACMKDWESIGFRGEPGKVLRLAQAIDDAQYGHAEATA